MKKRIRTKFERAVDSTWFLWRAYREDMEWNRRHWSKDECRSLLTWMRLNKKGIYSA